jgi:glucose/arabinose dehydrogenase
MSVRSRCLAVFCVCLATATNAAALVADARFEETAVATIPGPLTGFAWAPDGSNRLFVLRQGGEVRIVEGGTLVTEPFVTVVPIHTTDECGLIGIAFDPSFVDNGYVYLFVTVSATEQRILRYTASGNTGTDATVIVTGLPTRGLNHNGGALGFGPDGMLYWAVGDNGDDVGARADLTSLGAKVGRAHPDGAVPKDNPFVDGDGPNNDYIWARGYRNPFTLTFQPKTGALWLNVVGQRYEQVFTVHAGDHGGWDQYEVTQPAGFTLPVVSYRTDNVDVTPIPAGGATRSGGVVTLKTSAAHRLLPGAKVSVAGVTDATFNATAFVSSVASANELSFPQAGPDATSGGGTTTSQAIGGAITGGAFWDSSAVPPDLRGNFMFGDFNSGRLMRSTLSEANEVTSVDELASAIERIVDVSVGPDGDLYYVGLRGKIGRLRYVAPAQQLVVSALNLRLPEGGSTAFAVRLASALTDNATREVSVQRSAGDPNVDVATGAELSFDASNWNEPQRVVLTSTPDADSVDGAATFTIASSGLTAESVDVRITDADTLALVVSMSSLEVVEGASATLEVSVSELPLARIDVAIALASDDASVSVDTSELVSFDSSNWTKSRTITVHADEDDDMQDGNGLLTVSASGLATHEVDVEIRDNDGSDSATAGAPAAGSGSAGDSGEGGGAGAPASEGGAGGEPVATVPMNTARESCNCRTIDTGDPRWPLSMLGAIALLSRWRRVSGRRRNDAEQQRQLS